MREQSRVSSAECNLGIYVSYLLGEPLGASCRRLGVVMSLSHDSVNRFLLREDYTPEDLLKEVRGKINPVGVVLSIDDTVIDKHYSKKKTELIDYYWSNKDKRVMLGVNLVTLYATDSNEVGVPINYRICKKEEGKTKHDYFREMLKEVKQSGVEIKYVTGDSWYASVENFKFLREEGLGFLFGIERIRKVSLERGKEQQVQTVDIPAQGLVCYLPKFGEVKIFKRMFKEEYRYYVLYSPDSVVLKIFKEDDFITLHNTHWKIEQYHRILKQVCNLEHFQVRKETAIRNHIFSSLCGYLVLAIQKAAGEIINHYEIKYRLFLETIARFVRQNPLTSFLNCAHSLFYTTVNA